MIVATAGHIDHGKTSLVRALTGVDTDRLPQEKARGISIDLGFAYAATPSGRTIGFVDVPGHERFIRNMLAGVCGIDAVMLVVAADDGVMPQTREHLAIVDLLGVSLGVVVVSKTDCVPGERIAEVHAEVRAALAATGLARSPILDVSSVTGRGVEALRGWLDAAAQAHATTHADGQAFRYVVDRAFTVAGSGTVVTGTVLQGVVRIGDRVHVSPSAGEGRVRAIQKNGVSCAEAQAGERCALNLAGVEREQVGRGRWLAAQDVSTTRIGVRLRVLDDAPHPVRHWTEVHLHAGTADVGAHIAIPGGAALDPGASALVEIHCDVPVSVVVGDRFIVRDPSATRTLGGGTVIDPFAPHRRVARERRAARLEAMSAPDAQTALAGLVAQADDGVDLVEFGRAFNLTQAARDDLAGKLALHSIGLRALSADRIAALKAGVTAEVHRFHHQSPQAKGVELAALRRAVAPLMTDPMFGATLRAIAGECGIEILGSVVRRVGHLSTANRGDEVLWQRVKPVLVEAGSRGLAAAELAVTLRLHESALLDFLHRKTADGELVRVTPKRFYPREVLAGLAAIAADLAARSAQATFTAAEFRDATGVNRTLAIEILETFDRLGITQRVGDVRKTRRDYVAVLGPAPARIEPGPAPRRNVPAPGRGGNAHPQRRSRWS